MRRVGNREVRIISPTLSWGKRARLRGVMGLSVQGEWKILGRLGVAEALQPQEHHPAAGICTHRRCPWSHRFPFTEQTETCVQWEGPRLLALPSAEALPVGEVGGGRNCLSLMVAVLGGGKGTVWQTERLTPTPALSSFETLAARACTWHTVGLHMDASLSLSLLRGA